LPHWNREVTETFAAMVETRRSGAEFRV